MCRSLNKAIVNIVSVLVVVLLLAVAAGSVDRTVADTPTGRIYWASGPPGPGSIDTANLDGSAVATLVTVSDFYDVALDVVNNKLYFTSPSGQLQTQIRRSNLDGSNVEAILDSSAGVPFGIDLDIGAGKMYWASFPSAQHPNEIVRANLDGSVIETVASFPDVFWPYDVALDLLRGKVYWTNGSEGAPAVAGIHRANLDGTGVEVVVPLDFNDSPTELAIDASAGKIYWVSALNVGGAILRANLDGTNVEEVISGLTGPWGLALDLTNGRLYWTELIVGTIKRSNLDGTDIQTIASQLDSPYGIVVDSFGEPLPTPFGTPNPVGGVVGLLDDDDARSTLGSGGTISLVNGAGLAVGFGFAAWCLGRRLVR